jgi:hypothetical protein
MRKSSKDVVSRYNDILKLHDQELRILSWSNIVELSNGTLLSDKNKKRLLRNRITKGSDAILNIMDILYGDDVGLIKRLLTENQHDRSTKGGKSVQLLYPNIRIQATENCRIAGVKGLTYKHILENGAWNKGLTKETSIGMAKLSNERTGSGNPMYGKPVSEETRRKQSKVMKDNIIEGRFTPNVHNSRTTTRVVYNGQKYRSSWEAAFQSVNPEYEYETIRIPYKLDDLDKVYIVDFVCHKNKIVVEIKPDCHVNRKIEQAKLSALAQWSLDNNYTMQVLGENWFVDHWDQIDLGDFEPHIRDRLEKMYETTFKKTNRQA